MSDDDVLPEVFVVRRNDGTVDHQLTRFVNWTIARDPAFLEKARAAGYGEIRNVILYGEDRLRWPS